MKLKDRFIIIIAIVVVIIICILYPSKHVYFEGDDNINSVISYSFKYNDDIDDILEEQKYIYSRDSYKEYLEDYLAVIVCEDNVAYLNQYKVFYTNEDTLISNEIEIELSDKCNFIISLPDMKETYDWDIVSTTENIKLNRKNNIDLDYSIDNNKQYKRENLYFQVNNSGKDNLVIQYKDSNGDIIKEIKIDIIIK